MPNNQPTNNYKPLWYKRRSIRSLNHVLYCTLQVTSPLKVSAILGRCLDSNCTDIATFCSHEPVIETGVCRCGCIILFLPRCYQSSLFLLEQIEIQQYLSTKFLISQGHAILSTFACSLVIHFMKKYNEYRTIYLNNNLEVVR